MKALRILALACAAAPAAFAQDLTLAELARRPELVPAQVTLTQPVKLQGRPAIAAGQKLTVVSIKGAGVEVETPDGRSVFTAKADDTDLLATAQATWKTRTPPQRALTLNQVLQRKELWPYRVTLKQVLRTNTGDIKPGEQAILIGVEGSDLLLVYEKGKFLFNIAPAGTDLIDSARKLLVDPKALPGRVFADLQGKLIHPATGAATSLGGGEPKYFLFYRGAGWCGPCRQFSPSLVRYYQDTKPKRPDFEVVFISGDKTPAEMAKYSKEMGFTWATVASARQPEMQIVNRLFTNLIPQLVVTDRAGTVLVDSAKVGTAAALQQFDALLKKG